MDRAMLREWISKRPGDRRSAVAGDRPPPAPHQQHVGRAESSRTCPAGWPGTAASSRSASAAQEAGLLRVTHDLTLSGDRPVRRRLPRDRQQGHWRDFAHRGWLRHEGKSVLLLDPKRLGKAGTLEPTNRARTPPRRRLPGPVRVACGQPREGLPATPPIRDRPEPVTEGEVTELTGYPVTHTMTRDHPVGSRAFHPSSGRSDESRVVMHTDQPHPVIGLSLSSGP